MAWTKENMPSFTPNIVGTPTEGLWTPTVDQRHRLGARFEDGHSRVYRYAKNGGTDMASGQMNTGKSGQICLTTHTQL